MDLLWGNLDHVFSALFELGYVDTALKKDWKNLYTESPEHWESVAKAIRDISVMKSIREIRQYIESLEPKTVDFLILEVAREYAEFTERDETIH